MSIFDNSQQFGQKIIITLSSVFGLLVGGIFSKLFFLGIIRLLKTYDIKYQISENNFIMTLGIFISIYFCIITLKNQSLKKLDLLELLNNDKSNEKIYVSHPLFGILGIAFIVIGFLIVYSDAKGYIIIPEKSSYFTLLCFTGLYLFVSQFVILLLRICRWDMKFYIKNMLSITEIRHRISGNKDMIYIRCLLVSITLFFMDYSYSKCIINKGGEGSFLIFISSFMAVLFFISSISVIYFKVFSEIEDERKRYQILNCIGITNKEVKKYITVEMGSLFLIPLATGLLLVYPYMAIEYLNSPYKNEALLNLVVIFILYSIFEFVFFFIIKRKYINAILS
jgi:Predicted permease.